MDWPVVYAPDWHVVILGFTYQKSTCIEPDPIMMVIAARMRAKDTYFNSFLLTKLIATLDLERLLSGAPCPAIDSMIIVAGRA